MTAHNANTKADPGIHEAVLQRVNKRGPNYARAIIFVLSFFLVAAAIWSSFVQVPGLVRADGELTARGALRNVEHLEGGTVAAILVEEGAEVQAGQVIARLSSNLLDIQIEQVTARAQAAGETIYRMRALLRDLPQDPTPESKLSSNSQALHLQKAQHKLKIERRRAASQLIRERASAIRTMRAIRDTAAKRLERADRQFKAYSELLERGAVSQFELNKKQDERDSIEAELLQTEAELSSTIASHVDAKNAYSELLLSEREETLTSLNEAIELKTNLDLQRKELELKRSNLEIRAPIAGIVQSTAIGVLGEVVEPGGMIAEILPTGVNLVADIRLTPNDVGQVDLNDVVAVNITTYPRKRYGQIEGQVVSISPTSITEPNEPPFFKVIVALKRQFIGLNGDSYPLRSGMMAQAELVTKSRSVAQYLLKPLDSTLSTALSEK